MIFSKEEEGGRKKNPFFFSLFMSRQTAFTFPIRNRNYISNSMEQRTGGLAGWSAQKRKKERERRTKGICSQLQLSQLYSSASCTAQPNSYRLLLPISIGTFSLSFFFPSFLLHSSVRIDFLPIISHAEITFHDSKGGSEKLASSMHLFKNILLIFLIKGMHASA